MNSRVPPPKAHARNPLAQSLALAVLGVALVGAFVMGAVVFAVLFGVFIVGYLVSLAHAWWRLRRIRRRASYIDRPQAEPELADYVDAELVEVTADAARRGSGGAA
jgi:uncharacterized protein (DUF2062 family)